MSSLHITIDLFVVVGVAEEVAGGAGGWPGCGACGEVCVSCVSCPTMPSGLGDLGGLSPLCLKGILRCIFLCIMVAAILV